MTLRSSKAKVGRDKSEKRRMGEDRDIEVAESDLSVMARNKIDLKLFKVNHRLLSQFQPAVKMPGLTSTEQTRNPSTMSFSSANPGSAAYSLKYRPATHGSLE